MKKEIKKVSDETKKAIMEWMAHCEHFKNAYFWSNRGTSASQRRSQEKREAFHYAGDGIELDFEIRNSCRNIYVTKSVYIDGRKTNATTLKKFLV